MCENVCVSACSCLYVCAQGCVCVCAQMCVLCAYAHVCAQVCVHLCVRVCEYMCVHICVCTGMCVCSCVVCACPRVCEYMCARLCVPMCSCVHMYMYIRVHTHVCFPITHYFEGPAYFQVQNQADYSHPICLHQAISPGLSPLPLNYTFPRKHCIVWGAGEVHHSCRHVPKRSVRCV